MHLPNIKEENQEILATFVRDLETKCLADEKEFEAAEPGELAQEPTDSSFLHVRQANRIL